MEVERKARGEEERREAERVKDEWESFEVESKLEFTEWNDISSVLSTSLQEKMTSGKQKNSEQIGLPTSKLVSRLSMMGGRSILNNLEQGCSVQ